MKDRNRIVIGPLPADDPQNIRSIDDRLQGVEQGFTDISAGVDEAAVREIVTTILVDYQPVPGGTIIVVGLPPGDASMYVSPNLVEFPIDVAATQRVCTFQSGSTFPLQVGRYLCEDTENATGLGAGSIVGTRTDSGGQRGVVFDVTSGTAASFAMSMQCWGFQRAGAALVGEPVTTGGTDVQLVSGGTVSLVSLTQPGAGYSIAAVGTAANPSQFAALWVRSGFQEVWVTTHTETGTQVASAQFTLPTYWTANGWARVEQGAIGVSMDYTAGTYYVKNATTTGSFDTATMPSGIQRHQVGLGSGYMVARSGTSLYVVTVTSGVTVHKANVFDASDVTHGLSVSSADVFRWGGYSGAYVPTYKRIELATGGSVAVSILENTDYTDGATTRPLTVADGDAVYVAQANDFAGAGGVFKVAG